MDTPEPELRSELEAFRAKWLSEVKSKQPAPAAGPSRTSHSRSASASGPAPGSPTATKSHLTTSASTHPTAHDEDDQLQPPAFDEILDLAAAKGKEVAREEAGELVTALDHFEAAVVRETQGNLGDSLSLYRKAFRMDSEVDRSYRKKHFPAGPPAHPPPSAPSVPTPASAPEQQPPIQKSTTDLISTFESLSIQPAPPEVEGAPAPPCPIASVPDELLAHILADVAVRDVADFARLSLVCKRLAHLVASEQRAWRRVCLGPEFGFGGMHYRFQRAITWGALPSSDPLSPEYDPSTAAAEEEEGEEGEEVGALSEDDQKRAATLALHPAPYPTWATMFRHRPRIRFNGCYISTVNYMRAGHGSANHITWNSPVHIVTYYRYLRFFRDGTAASLLTTSEPADVVPHLTRAAVDLHRAGGGMHLPSAVVRKTLRGRWRLGTTFGEGEGEGDLVIETEGAGERYVYRMDLALRSAGKAARNNKLAWRGFYSYNKLTDDWGEFLRRNERPFLFSRVRSYGVGE